MKALILNSGLGKRMGKYTENSPKCMVPLYDKITIVSRQIEMLKKNSVTEIIMTTGPFEDKLIKHISDMHNDVNITYVNNPIYDKTNYIYSIYLAKQYLDDDIILMHGDLVFDETVLRDVINSKDSCMCVSSILPLPEKDFKAVITEGRISAVGIEFFENSVAAQPLYHLKKEDWSKWLSEISCFCEMDQRSCYAENALNKISSTVNIYPFDFKDRLCQEVDKEEDLLDTRNKLGV